MRPNGLNQTCVQCRNRMPYNPTNTSNLCSSCNQLHAMNSPTNVPSNVPPSYQHTSSSQPMASPTSLKRKADGPLELLTPRPSTKAYAPRTPSLLRNQYTGLGAEAAMIGARALKNGDAATDDEEDEFVDALVEQVKHETKSAAITQEGSDADAEGSVVDEEGPAVAEAEPEDIKMKVEDYPESDVESEADDDEGDKDEADQDIKMQDSKDEAFQEPQGEAETEDTDDLFARTFGASNPTDSDDSADESPTFDRTNFIQNIKNGTTKAPTTKKPKEKPTLPPGVPIPTLIPKHVSTNFKNRHTFHLNAILHTPRLPLAPHRYWIAVLKPSIQPRNARSEKHFTWMRGNRLTTIETIWNAYRHASTEQDVVLFLGWERAGMRMRCEEMDWFGDKRVVLRAVLPEGRTLKGRGPFWGVKGEAVQEEEAKQKKREEAKAKVVSREVIEID